MEDGIGQPPPILQQAHRIRETLNFSREHRQRPNSILENGLVDQREISRQLRATRTPSPGDGGIIGARRRRVNFRLCGPLSLNRVLFLDKPSSSNEEPPLYILRFKVLLAVSKVLPYLNHLISCI